MKVFFTCKLINICLVFSLCIPAYTSIAVQYSYLSFVSSSGAVQDEYPNTVKFNNIQNGSLSRFISNKLKSEDIRKYDLLFDNSDTSNDGKFSLVVAVDKERIFSFKFNNKCLNSYFLSTQTILYDPRDQRILLVFPNATRRNYIDPAQDDCSKRDKKIDFIRFTEFYLGLDSTKEQLNQYMNFSNAQIVESMLELSSNNKSMVIDPIIKYINNLDLDNLTFAKYVGINEINISDDSMDFYSGKTFDSYNKYFSKNGVFSAKEYKDWVGQQFVKWFSDKYSYPLVPYAEGEALGRQVNMKFADRDELFQLTLPPIDHGFNITLTKPPKKVFLRENGGIKLYAFAQYADIGFMTNFGGGVSKEHFYHSIKNGRFVKVVEGDETDNWENFNNSLNELFYKYIDNLSLRDKSFIKNQVENSDFKKFKKNTENLLNVIGIEYEN